MVFLNIFVFSLHSICVAVILKILNSVLPSFVTTYYGQMAVVVLFIHISLFSYDLAKKQYFRKRIKSKNKAVLVTGCDTGLGHELAKRLDRRGFTVFASCLFPSESGATALKENCSGNLNILELDVTNDDSVKSAVEFVKKNLGACELYAIVNNAGIQKGFSVDFSSLPEYADTMEVNAFGVVRVTKAFLPLLRKSKGRIINLTSLAGRLPTPYIAPYCMSKYAAVAFTECLSFEMAAWGIRVISVEPEFCRTQLFNPTLLKKRIEESLKNTSDDVKEIYDEERISQLQAYFESLRTISAIDFSPVISDLESAVSLKNPASVYRPCRNIVAQIICYLAFHTPRILTDLAIKTFLYLSGCPGFHKQDKNSHIMMLKNVCNKLVLRVLYCSGLHRD